MYPLRYIVCNRKGVRLLDVRLTIIVMYPVRYRASVSPAMQRTFFPANIKSSSPCMYRYLSWLTKQATIGYFGL